MKHFNILVLFFLSLNTFSQNCNIGNENVTNDFTNGNFGANYLLGVKHTLSQVGTLNSINLIGNNTGVGVQMAVYDDNNGVPNNLIAYSSQSFVGNGLTSLPVTPVLLSPGDYWIMAIYQIDGNNSNVNLTALGNVVYYTPLVYGSAIPTNASGFISYTEQDFLYFLGIDCGNTICPPSTGTDTRTECNSYTWIDGNVYTASNNTATHNIIGGSANGCDSLVSLNLTIVNSTAGTDTRTECNSYTWIDGNVYTASNNTATHNIIGGSANGCDSLVTLNLTIVNSTAGMDTRTECNSYTWIDGNVYTASNNTATHNIIGGGVNGCDSLVTLNLTINNISDITTSVSGITITANNSGATYQWLDCDNNNALIAGETGQSFIASANGNYAVQLTENGCIDTTSCVSITSAGIIENSFGDNLLVYPNPTNGNFSIDLGEVYENSNVLITAISGKLIQSRNITQSQVLNLSIEEPAGIYVVSIQAGNKSAVIQLVKK